MADDTERQMLQLIVERDAAEEAMSQAYYIVTGRSPEWSNRFGYAEALEEIGDAVALLKNSIAIEEPPMPAPDYKGFAKWCLEEGPWQGCDLDGGDTQAAALKFGIIKQVSYNPKVHGETTDCYVESGDPWFIMVESE